jgi:hypothetical protein
MNCLKSSSLFFILLFALCVNLFAQQKTNVRYLQVSTNPSTVDLYTGDAPPDFSRRPAYTSPAFIPVPKGAESITVSFFHPDYADTTINISLSSSDTSFIIVALRQTYDDDILADHQDMLQHRSRRNLGRALQWFSIAPFVISGISAIVTLYDIGQANDHKKAMENTRFMNEKYDAHMREFKDYRGRAKTSKTVSKVFLGTGLLFLATGFALSF